MIGWTIFFLLIALVAGALGFGGIAGTAIDLAQLVFFVALVLLAVSVIYQFVGSRRAPPARRS